MDRRGLTTGPDVTIRRLVVHGRVHGVGFRASCVARARDLRLTGWVRNLADGTVEVLAAGSAADVDALAAWCRQGPPLARVTAVAASDGAGMPGAEPGAGFTVR